MRVWISGPRMFRGLVRLGISFGPEDFKTRRPARAADVGRPEGSFVYVIRGEHGLHKIGISTNPNARLAQLRTASPFPLDFEYVACMAGNGFAVERMAHEILAARRVAAEWFDCPAEAAVAAVAVAAHKTGEKLAEIDPKIIDDLIGLSAAESNRCGPKNEINAFHFWLFILPVFAVSVFAETQLFPPDSFWPIMVGSFVALAIFVLVMRAVASGSRQ